MRNACYEALKLWEAEANPRFIVEVSTNNDIYDNWVGDYIEAETAEEALELCKQWIIDNGEWKIANPEDYINGLWYRVYQIDENGEKDFVMQA